MPNTYSELFYHFVWSTTNRVEQLTPDVEQPLFDYINAKTRGLDATVLAINDMRDHVHLACTLPPRISPSEFMHRVKGASSHYVNHGGRRRPLSWQVGYGVLSFARRDLQSVLEYVQNQKVHHANGSLRPKLEQTGEI